MATANTLSQFRDIVRRYIQILPPVDEGGSVGAAPLGQPDPNNAMVNQAINDGIDAINRVVRVGLETDLTIATPVPPTTNRGVLYVDYSSVIPNALTAAEVTDVVWFDGLQPTRLFPVEYYADERDYTQFQQLIPGQASGFVVTASQIGLVPSPATTGKLIFNAATTIPNLVADGDTIAYLPVEYQIAVVYWAVVFLSIRQATNVEAATRAQAFGPIATSATMQIYSWKNGFDDTSIPSVKAILDMMWRPQFQQDLQPAPQQGGGQQ